MRNHIIFIALLLAGCGSPSLLITPVSNSQKLNEIKVERASTWSSDKIAVIEVEGMLLNARSGGFLQPEENKVSLFKEQLSAAARDEAVKAIVLRVNSPGGTVAASDTMHQMVVRFKQETGKPVITSAQDIMASGAYYIALASDRIIVHPASVVGSIGVIYHTFDFEGTMGKIGMRQETIQSGPFKDMGSPFKKLADEEREIMQGVVDEYYLHFRSLVSQRRTITDPQKLTMATDGRIFSGTQAVEIGLADQTGLLEDAIALAKKSAGVTDASVILYKRPYGYSGTIYSSTHVPNVANEGQIILNLPDTRSLLPNGFYYLWEP